ncbi:phage tail tape measure protein [Xanthobacter autotrophicus]|uniref:phage tail tape measure protein n=1 Tax=Xanthobacter TaxID=279 RepID=UPI0024AA0C75|nr:phage tail tape measure protein [Xanthobacter autotrophicus]MDI4665269.1 phage tail tape measure protein [Xanthobacter autotrophicus]
MTETIDIAIELDTRTAKAALGEVEVSAKGFASALASAFTGLAVQGKDLGSVLEQLAARLSNLALTAALKPLESGLSSLFSGAAGGLGFAQGGAISDGRVMPFARGGVVASPTYFPLGGASLGLMGEKGAEAILPLARGADGKLGVRSAEGTGRAAVTVNVSTPDVAGFRRSEAYLSGLVARAVARGQRGA